MLPKDLNGGYRVQGHPRGTLVANTQLRPDADKNWFVFMLLVS